MASETFEVLWTRAGLGEAPHDSTIKPVSHHGSQATLPLLVIEDAGHLPHRATDLVLQRPIGEGGMGVVWAALQPSLDRVVALKRTRPDAPEPVRRSLVAEALVLGSLEHPNILPVHLLGADEDGAPVLVMKRVEGASWRALIHEPDHEWWAGEGEDRLRRHVEIAIAVCRALEFAHDKGVVHRDLKPDNVMIGRFGEVYLMDWGVARRLDGAPRRHVVGTPAYLAPELLDLTLPLGPWTDGYLLGSCLVEVLTGAPPHGGATLQEVMRSVHAARPPALGAEVPAALAAVVRRVMAAAPADRYPDARSLREALEGFLRSREAGQLAEVGEGLLRELAAAPAERVDAVFAECRFAFRLAQRVAPDPAVQRGLAAALTAMIPVLARRGDVEGAETLLRELSELGGAPEALVASVDAARRERRQVASLVRDMDLGVSAGTRAALFGAGVLVFLVVAMVILAFPEGYDEGTGFVIATSTYAVALALMAVFRRPLTANHATRQLTGVFVGMACTHVLHRFAAWWYAIGVPALLFTDLVIMAAAGGATAFVVGPRMLATTAVALLAAFAVVVWPSGAMVWFTLGSVTAGVVGTAFYLDLWRRKQLGRL